MGGELQISGQGRELRALDTDSEVASIVDRCLSGAVREFGNLLMLNAPSVEDRRRLSARNRSIVDGLSHFDQHAVASAVADCIACYRNFIKSEEAPEKVVAKYVKELQGVPTWACVQACDSIRAATAPGISLQYPFSTMQLRELAESYTLRFREEAARISSILRGKSLPAPISDEERAKVHRNLARLAHKMKLKLVQEARVRAAPGNALMKEASERFLLRELIAKGQPGAATALAPSPSLLSVLQRKGEDYGSDRATEFGSDSSTPGMEKGEKQAKR